MWYPVQAPVACSLVPGTATDFFSSHRKNLNTNIPDWAMTAWYHWTHSSDHHTNGMLKWSSDSSPLFSHPEAFYFTDSTIRELLYDLHHLQPSIPVNSLLQADKNCFTRSRFPFIDCRFTSFCSFFAFLQLLSSKISLLFHTLPWQFWSHHFCHASCCLLPENVSKIPAAAPRIIPVISIFFAFRFTLAIFLLTPFVF